MPVHHGKQKRLRVSDWERMVVNPGSTDPVRTPSQAPFTGAVRTFTRTFEITRAGVGRDEFQLIVRPSLQRTLILPAISTITPGANNVFDTGDSASVTDFSQGAGYFGLKGLFQVHNVATGDSLGEVVQQYDEVVGPYWPLTGSATTVMAVSLGGASYTQAKVFLRIGGVWTDSATFVPAQSLDVTPGGNFDGLWVGVSGPRQSQGYDLQLRRGAAAASDIAVAPFMTHDVFTTDAVSLSRVSSHRVTALSALASYSGNQFNNGGVIAAARTRAGFAYDDNNAYQALSKLQDHSYRGPIRDGAYVWWLPYDLDELDFRGALDTPSETELRIAGEFADADGALQVVLTMTVEFYSPLQIFEHEVGPALTDDFVRAYHRIDSMPAATCNPQHTKILRGILNSAGRGAKGAAKTVLSNPELMAALLAMI